MIDKKIFDTLPDGRTVDEYIMKNNNGMEVHVLSYACIIKDIIIPKDGRNYNVVLGWDSLDEYMKHGYETYYYGSFVGRVANRIKNARFELNGRQYRLSANEGNHHLHGSFRDTLFAAQIIDDSVAFTYYSPDSDEGYPGNLQVACIYTLTEENDLVITYEAVSDDDTVVNLTNHSYFNLNGRDSGCIYDHLLEINADAMTETDDDLNCTGNIIEVADTDYDFRVLRPIGKHPYDDNFCLSPGNDSMKIAAQVNGDKSGIVMYCGTTQIGLQLYCGHKDALCLETQHYPSSPNIPSFPSIVLKKDEKYRQQTIYKFEW